MPETSEISKHLNVEISVKNFGPIAEATINLHPLTVFVGPSNTGKTYFSTLTYALHGIFNGFSQLPGTSRQMNHFDFWNPLGKNDEIRETLKKLNTINQPFKFSDLPQSVRIMLQSKIKDPEILKDELKRCFDLNSVTELIRWKDGQRSEMQLSLKVHKKNQNLMDLQFGDL